MRIGDVVLNGNKNSLDKSSDFREKHILQKEFATNMYRSRKVDFTGKLSAFLSDDYVRGNQFGKIVHSFFGKDFL